MKTGVLADQLGHAWPVADWLQVAIGLASEVGRLHEAGRLHRDIQPLNIVVGERIALTDSKTSALAYMAPERTGRINRDIDTRADLYSVGITLYELATGALPFHASDAMEWAHCHIARQPTPPSTLPGPLVQVVMKLLAKTADDRYQTALGLEADLRAFAAGTPFELGHADVSSRFTIPQRLYGREQEIEQLRGLFARVAERGTREVAMVSGYSGIGKSSVIRELHLSRGLFAVGKYDQQKIGIPYAPFAQAFRELITQVPAAALAEALAVNGALLVSLIPELEAIVGTLPPVPDVPPADAQRRFHDVFRKFVSVFAQPERPLVLFLDDLQWFDPASVALLTHLATEPNVQHVLLIGAFRDNEIAADHPLHAIRANKVVLRPLSRDSLAQLVGDALHTTAARPLAELVHDKTGGNPFFAIQLLKTFVERDLVRFDGSAWIWDLDQIQGLGFTDNVAELVATRLGALPPDLRAGLRQLACLGHSLRSETLALLPALPMQAYVDAGVLVRTHDGYAFAHDRILETAYALIPATERVFEHARIGWTLAKSGRDDLLFDIVHHLNHGAGAIGDRSERDRAAELDLAASKRARSSTAASSALRYATAGRAFLDDESDHRLVFELELQLADCEFMMADLATAEARLDALAKRATTFAESAAVMFVQGKLYTQMADRSNRAIQIGLALLATAGIEWTEAPSKELVDREYAELVARIGDRTVEQLCDVRPLVDEHVRCMLEVLHAMFGPAHALADQKLLCLLLCRMGNLGLEHGFSDASPFAFAYLGMIVAGHFDDVPTGYKLAKLALDLVERGFQRYRGRVWHTFGTHVVPFAEPIANAQVWLRRAIEASREGGDITYLAFSSLTICTAMLGQGDPLDGVQTDARATYDLARSLKFELVADCTAGMLRLATAAKDHASLDDDRPDARYEQDAPPSDRGSDITFGFYWTRALQARILYRDLPEALVALKKAEAAVALNNGFFELAEFHTAAALTVVATGGDPAVHRARLAKWAEHCPANFDDRVALVDAEIAWMAGDDLVAMRAYERAIAAARTHDLVAREAVACELAARFYTERSFATPALAYAEQAHAAYRRWGATGKLRQLEQLYPDLARTALASFDGLDLATVAKTSEAVSAAVGVDRLIDSLMTIALQHAGAQRGLLVLNHDGVPTIEAEAITHQDGVRVRVQRVGLTGHELPMSVLQRALGDREVVLIDDARAILAGTRSVLCLPLVRESHVIGALYLENNLTSHAFRRDHLDVLKLLVAHAAVSLENAWLEQKQAEALRTAGERMRLALRGAEIGVWEFEMPDGNIENSSLVFHNYGDHVDSRVPWARTLAGWHPDDRDRVVGAIKAYLAGETDHYEAQARFAQQDGSYRTRIARGVAVRDATGKPIRFIGSSVDISERLEIAEALRISEERYRNTFERAPVGFVHTDFANNKVLRVNEAFCRITGYSREELLGPAGIDMVHPEDRPKTLDRFRKLESGELESYTARFRIYRKDGELIWIRLNVSIGRDRPGSPPYALGIIEDISEPQRLEQAMQLAKDAAESSNRAKDEFLANVSHEIRTPMNAILGMTELVLDSELTDSQRQSLGTVTSAASSLLVIIDDLLDFSKIEAGKLELDPAPFRLRELFGDTMQALSIRAHRKGLEISCHIATAVPDLLLGDAGRLRQVLINLVGNAIKFTSHGEVRVDVDADVAGPEAVLHVRVRDTGIGIDETKRDKIFRAFEQEDMSTTRRYGGTGLGLTIASRLVAMMGGAIRVESTQGVGSTFTFDARFTWQTQSDAEPPRSVEVLADRLVLSEPEREAAVPLRVLVAEDNGFNARLLRQLLASRGHVVRVASDGREALRLALSGNFDLLLLDLHMPELDGFEVIAALRDAERATDRHLPVIALTARTRAEDRRRCFEAGMDDFLAKPIRAEALWAAIEERTRRTDLISADVLLAACGGDAQILAEIRDGLAERLPNDLAAIEDAFAAGDAKQLRERAHSIAGMLAAFSTTASRLASEIEDVAATGNLERAGLAVAQLRVIAQDLMRAVATVTLETLDRK
ncbi:MAG: AAA family ATPase [Kofleriaceae bacterium]